MTTEDEQPLDETAAEQGLVLRLAPTGTGRAEEITVSMSPGVLLPTDLNIIRCEKVHYTKFLCQSHHTDSCASVRLLLCRGYRAQKIFRVSGCCCCCSHNANPLLRLPSGHCAGSSRPEEGAYDFPTEALTLAGEYAVTAEFRETRSELTRVLTKKTAVLRSSAATFEVHPRLQILSWEQQY